MAVKVRNSLFIRLLLSPWGKAGLLFLVLLLTTGVGTFTYFYVKYARLTDDALKAGPFSNMSLLYAAPRPVSVGEEARGEEIAAYLRQCGYSDPIAAAPAGTGFVRMRLRLIPARMPTMTKAP